MNSMSEGMPNKVAIWAVHVCTWPGMTEQEERVQRTLGLERGDSHSGKQRGEVRWERMQGRGQRVLNDVL